MMSNQGNRITQGQFSYLTDLTDEQIGRTGVVLEQTKTSMLRFEALFSDGADRILALLDCAKSNT